MLICLLTFPIISHNLAKKVVKDAIGCHLLLDTYLHRSVQGCCCIQGLLWRTRGNLLGCDYSLFYGIFPLPYCKVLLAKTSETIIIQTISVLFCVYMTLVANITNQYGSLAINYASCIGIMCMKKKRMKQVNKNLLYEKVGGI